MSNEEMKVLKGTERDSLDSSPILELLNIKKEYDEPGGDGVIPILRGLSLTVRRGESVAITGPSGSGKTTLLNIMGALDQPSEGDVVLSGKKLRGLAARELAKIRNLEVGFVFQLHHLLPQCTLLENVLIPTIPDYSEIQSLNHKIRAIELLGMVGLASHVHHRPGQLSGGERQRAAVARALINQPKILLADEPTGSLDQDSALSLVRLLTELNEKQAMTLVMVTHAPRVAAFMKRQFKLEHGVLIE
jgi:ABC-type lipoprotein export system ATPase subunit